MASPSYRNEQAEAKGCVDRKGMGGGEEMEGGEIKRGKPERESEENEKAERRQRKARKRKEKKGTRKLRRGRKGEETKLTDDVENDVI